MLYSGTDPESYITEYTLVYEDKVVAQRLDLEDVERVVAERLGLFAQQVHHNLFSSSIFF